MSPALKARFDSLDERIEAFIAKVDSYPVEVQTAPVGPSFSPLDALEHMGKLEQKYVDQIEASRGHRAIGKPSKVRFTFGIVLKMMEKPAGEASPAPKMFEPTGRVSPEIAAQVWREARARVRKRAEEFEDDQTCMVNLIFGAMSPRKLCEIFESHQAYHEARLP